MSASLSHVEGTRIACNAVGYLMHFFRGHLLKLGTAKQGWAQARRHSRREHRQGCSGSLRHREKGALETGSGDWLEMSFHCPLLPGFKSRGVPSSLGDARLRGKKRWKGKARRSHCALTVYKVREIYA